MGEWGGWVGGLDGEAERDCGWMDEKPSIPRQSQSVRLKSTTYLGAAVREVECAVGQVVGVVGGGVVRRHVV